MADETKGKCDWAPLTPAKFIPARYEVNSTGIGLNHGVVSVENPNLSRIWGKLGYEEKESGNYGCEIGNIGRVCFGKSADGKVHFLVGHDKRPHQETIELEASLVFGSDSTKASNEAKNETPHRRNQGKRSKMKRHRPKVFDKTKTKKKSSTPTKPMKPSTPKPRTPKRPKLVKKNSLDKTSVEQPSKNVDRELLGDSNEKNCRRKLDLDIENWTMNQNSKACDEIESKPEQSGSRFSSLRVYTRIFKPNECLKNSRKLGPNCPSVFKKARMMRRRATAFDKFIRLVSMIPTTRKKKRAAMNEPMKLDQIVRDRKMKPRTLLSPRKEMTREAVKHPTFEKYSSNLTWMVKRKRSETSFRKKRDLSSFVSDFSKLRFSETFLSKASTIRTKDTGPDKFAATVEAQDEGIHNLDIKKSIEQQELPQDNMVSCNEGIQHLEKKKSIVQQEFPCDNVFSCNESIQNCPADFEDHMLGVEMDLPEHNSNIDDMFNYRSEKPSDSDVKTPSFVGPRDEEEDVSSIQDYDAFTKALVD